MSTRRAELAEWIAHADPAGLLYGGIITASVLARARSTWRSAPSEC